MNDDHLSDANAREEIPAHTLCVRCGKGEFECRNGLRDIGDTHRFHGRPGRDQLERNTIGITRCREVLAAALPQTTDDESEAP